MPLQEMYERGQLARTNFLYDKAVFMARMQVRQSATVLYNCTYTAQHCTTAGVSTALLCPRALVPIALG
jgi:hypothetical protein